MNTLDEKLKTVSNNVPKVYNAGYSKGEVEGYDKGYTAGSGAVNAFIDRSITEISSDMTSIGNYAFHSCSKLTSADFPNATSIGSSAFYGCSKLTSADFPNATSIGGSAFYQCLGLISVVLLKAEKIDLYTFFSCSKLTSADFPNATSIGSNAFSNCYTLTTVILRSETLCTLSYTNVFSNCYHILGKAHSSYNPNGDNDGYVYVPRALVDSYKTATNWSTFASQFRALEDYTVDGTITGELDETKI